MSAARQSLASPPRWRYCGAALAAALLLALVSAYAVWQVRTTDYASDGRALLNTARLVADDIENSFDRFDALLTSLGRQYVHGVERGPEERLRLAERMGEENADFPSVARILVVDWTGRPVLGSGAFAPEMKGTNISDGPAFKRAAAGQRGPIFEGPLKSKLTGEWEIILARRLEDGRGDFLGMVSAAIPLESVTKMFSRLDTVNHGVVALWTDAGVLVARHTREPGAEDRVGEGILSRTAMALLRAHPGQDHDLYDSVSSVDRIPRLFAYQKLEHSPYLVVVGQPKAALDQSWRRLALELGLLSLAVAVAAFWIARRLRASAALLGEDNRLLERRVAIRTEEIETKTRALIASERKFSDAMANAPIGMALFTPDGRYVEVNAALCDIFGFSREAFLAPDPRGLATPGEAPAAFACTRCLAGDGRKPCQNETRVLQAGTKACRGERRFRHKDGREIPTQIDMSVIRDASGGVRYLVAQIQDISARLAYEDRLKALLDTAVDGVCISDLDGAIVEFSQSFADMLGYARDEIKTLNIADFDVGTDPGVLRPALRALAESGRARIVETRHRRKDGSFYDAEIHVKAVRLGGQTYLYASARDITERVRMQRRLDRKRRQLYDFSNASADWFWELDENLNFTYFSESFKGIGGSSAQVLLGTALSDLYAKDVLNPGAHKAESLATFRAREPFRDFEFAYTEEGAEIQWLSTSGVPFFDDDGGFAGYRGVATVITARKRAETALEENRQLLQELVDSSPYGIGVFDRNRECVVRNANYGRILDLPRDFLDRKPYRLIDQFRFRHARGDYGGDYRGESGQALVDPLLRKMDAGELLHSARRLSNGRWVEARSTPLAGGHVVTTFFDVTNYKTIETELRAKTERLEVAAAAGIVGLWAIDLASGEMFWDRVQRQLYGLTGNDFEITPDAFYKTLHPDDEQRVRASIRRAFEGEGAVQAEFRIVRRDGAVRYLKGLSRTFCGVDGKPERVAGVTYDVTDQKETLHALEEARIQAEAASKAKSEFIANISHEIRTPINAIVGMTQILSRSALDEEQAHCVQTLDSAGHTMLAMISDVLDLSKIEARQLDLDAAPFSLAEVIGAVSNAFAVSANRKGLALRVEAPPDDFPEVIGDASRLGQVLSNFLGNAIKFTLQGEVAVCFEALDRSADSVRVRVAVRDTGIGIAEEHIGKLFEPFVQAESTTSGRFGGTGLGLAISKRLIDLMGGAIGVESELGLGSAFWFAVSLKVAPLRLTKGTGPADRPEEKPLSGVRVLVVDDTETNREIATKLLSLEGANCEEAANGRAAIERLRTNPGGFDLVLMDVQMPDMDGLETTRVIRHDLGLVELPVIALTAGAMASQRELALAAGMNSFIAKPFRLRELVAALLPWLRRDRRERR